MPDIAVLHSGRAVGLVGQDVVASITNNGEEDVFLGLADVTAENHFQKLNPGETAVLKGPVFASSTASCPVIVQDDPDALRAAAPKSKPKPAAKAAPTKKKGK